MIEIVIQKKIFSKLTGWILIVVFAASSFLFVTSLNITINFGNDSLENTIIPSPETIEFNSDLPQNSNDLLANVLDDVLYNWVITGKKLDENYKRNFRNEILISVIAADPVNTDLLNSYMNIESFVDFGGAYIIMGSVSSADNLIKIAEISQYMRIGSDPVRKTPENIIQELD